MEGTQHLGNLYATLQELFKDKPRIGKGVISSLLGSSMDILTGVIYKKNCKRCSAGVAPKSYGSFATSF
ncbi:hypothetical protein DB41_GZ00510 [Neochlamydia sp. TUME1]|nr:hypothetical protein DB41_GZ00510 [Neochlamydia sp. TUME1]